MGEAGRGAKSMTKPQPIETAPKDGTEILLLTSDFGWVQGRWDASVRNFYKGQEGWASYDPENAQGDWVSFWRIGDDTDLRLYCGCTPHYWMPLPKTPERRHP